MANSLTNLIPDLYESLDIVSREMTGFIGAVTMNSGIERAALNETVRIPQAGSASASDVSASPTLPTPSSSTISNLSVSLTKSRKSNFFLTGEEEMGLGHGPGAGNIRVNLISQAFRTLTNEVEADLASLYSSASRATGASGTTPFGSNLSEAADARQLLVDNGSPTNDLQLVLNTTGGTALRSLAQLTSSDQAASDVTLRQGELLPILGFQTRESAQVKSHTSGTASGATTDNTGYAVGSTTITLAAAGTGTILSGDAISFAGDSNIYCVTSGDADVSNGGTITLAEPGLRQAIAASATAISVKADYVGNMAFSRSAVVLAMRPPALPEGGDLAVDRTLISDPHSGLIFEVSQYPGYREMVYEVAASWGYSLIKPEHSAILLG